MQNRMKIPKMALTLGNVKTLSYIFCLGKEGINNYPWSFFHMTFFCLQNSVKTVVHIIWLISSWSVIIKTLFNITFQVHVSIPSQIWQQEGRSSSRIKLKWISNPFFTKMVFYSGNFPTLMFIHAIPTSKQSVSSAYLYCTLTIRMLNKQRLTTGLQYKVIELCSTIKLSTLQLWI